MSESTLIAATWWATRDSWATHSTSTPTRETSEWRQVTPNM